MHNIPNKLVFTFIYNGFWFYMDLNIFQKRKSIVNTEHTHTHTPSTFDLVYELSLFNESYFGSVAEIYLNSSTQQNIQLNLFRIRA